MEISFIPHRLPFFPLHRFSNLNLSDIINSVDLARGFEIYCIISYGQWENCGVVTSSYQSLYFGSDRMA